MKQELHIPFKEKLKSIPDFFGIRTNEEPAYQLIQKDGKFEIRKYEKQIRAEISMIAKDFETFREMAFEILANYIFGGNNQKLDLAMTSPTVLQNKAEHIAMTSPVIEQTHGQNEWKMSFILPAKYEMSTVPQPNNKRIKLEEVPSYEVAVVVYSGNNTPENINEHQNKLAVWMAGRKDFRREGNFFSAQYDAPFVISFLKRNEIQIKITRAH